MTEDLKIHQRYREFSPLFRGLNRVKVYMIRVKNELART